MPETSAPVTWEFLEAVAVQLALIADEPAPNLVLKEGLWNVNLAMTRGQIPLDPGLLAILTPEEATFLIAYMMAVRRMQRQLYSVTPQGPPGPWLARRNAYWATSTRAFLVTMTVIITLLVTTTVTGHSRSFPYLLIPAFAVAITLQVIVQMRGVRKIQWGYFEDAAAIAGSRAAGRSCLAKLHMFYASKRGTRRLTGWRRWIANVGIKMAAPPA